MNNRDLHFIWLGSDLGAEDSARIDAWCKVSRKMTIWSEIPKDIRDITNRTDNLLAKSDVFRYWIMLKFGGIYLDTDTEPGNIPLSELPTNPFAGGCLRADGVTPCWSNFLLGTEKPGRQFFADLIDRCRADKYENYGWDGNPVYQFNIEALLGIVPTVKTVPCWNNRPCFAVPEKYFCKHLSRTNPEDYALPMTAAKRIGPSRMVRRPGSQQPQRTPISEEQLAIRQSTCRECEFLLPNDVCKKCGCSGRNKSRIAEVHCPINKW